MCFCFSSGVRELWNHPRLHVLFSFGITFSHAICFHWFAPNWYFFFLLPFRKPVPESSRTNSNPVRVLGTLHALPHVYVDVHQQHTGKPKHLHSWLVQLSIHRTTKKASTIDKVCILKSTSIHTVLTNVGVAWWMLIPGPYTPQQALTDEAAVAVFVNVRPNNEVLFHLSFLLKVTLYSDVWFQGAEKLLPACDLGSFLLFALLFFWLFAGSFNKK